MRSNSDEVEKNNECFRNLHLTTAYGGASPRGEAFESFASKPYVSQYKECRNITKKYIDNILRFVYNINCRIYLLYK